MQNSASQVRCYHYIILISEHIEIRLSADYCSKPLFLMVLAMMACLIRFSRNARPKLFYQASISTKSHKIGLHS